MISKFKFTALAASLLVGSFLQADMEEAKEMFNDAKCMECHTQNHFKPKENKVNNFKKLSSSVNACASSSDAGWFDEEADSVTRYLNKKHYHFKAPPKEEE